LYTVKEMMRNYGIPRHLNNFVMGNETWLYYYDVQLKQVWLFEDEPTPTQVQNSRLIKKK